MIKKVTSIAIVRNPPDPKVKRKTSTVCTFGTFYRQTAYETARAILKLENDPTLKWEDCSGVILLCRGDRWIYMIWEEEDH